MNQDESRRRPASAKNAAKKVGHFALKTTEFTVDVAAGTVRTGMQVIATILLVLLIGGMMFGCIFAYYVKTCLTPQLSLSLDDYKLSESSTILYQDSSGQWQELITLAGDEDRIWVDYDQIPWYMEKAIVAIEDKRFYEHKGVDWYRTSGAFVTMFATMQNNYGGSTITQQLIKNLTGEDDITVIRKLTEIFGALELEKTYSKQQIVEWYLNAVYFGEGCYGVETAANTYFGKHVSELSLAESAAIVGITNKPTYYDPFFNEGNNRERRETILREMYDQGFIDYTMYKEAMDESEVMQFTRSPGEETAVQTVYSYFEEVVIDDAIHDLMAEKGINYKAARTLLYNGGYQIYSSINVDIQNIVDNLYADISTITRAQSNGQPLQSAIVIMDPYTGEIVALSGGVGQKNANFVLNRATGTYRSPGSSIKPLASYGPATEYGIITPSTRVNDSPYLSLNGTSWYPSNDGGGNFGIVTIYQALQYSLNTVAAQIVDKLSPEVSYNFLTNRLGFTSLVPDDASYAPMALGQLTNGVTVREMAQAYCSFVNNGTFTYSRSYTRITDRDGNTIIDNSPRTISAFSPNTAHVMTYMMQNAVENGTGTEARLSGMAVAGKTGTSGQYKDRWFCGCTPYYVAAVWTGFDIPAYMSVSGNPAARIWRNIMAQVHAGLDYRSFDYPYLGEPTNVFDLDEEEKPKEEDQIILDGYDNNSSGGSYTGGGNTVPNNPPDMGNSGGNGEISFG